MRGVAGYRVSDVMNGALAQLVPDRVPAAGDGGSTLAWFAGELDGESFVYIELVVGTWGGTPEDDGNDGVTNPASLVPGQVYRVTVRGITTANYFAPGKSRDSLAFAAPTECWGRWRSIMTARSFFSATATRSSSIAARTCWRRAPVWRIKEATSCCR